MNDGTHCGPEHPPRSQAYQDLYDNHDGMRDNLAGFWAAAARQFADVPGVIGYELIKWVHLHVCGCRGCEQPCLFQLPVYQLVNHHLQAWNAMCRPHTQVLG